MKLITQLAAILPLCLSIRRSRAKFHLRFHLGSKINRILSTSPVPHTTRSPSLSNLGRWLRKIAELMIPFVVKKFHRFAAVSSRGTSTSVGATPRSRNLICCECGKKKTQTALLRNERFSFPCPARTPQRPGGVIRCATTSKRSRSERVERR